MKPLRLPLFTLLASAALWPAGARAEVPVPAAPDKSKDAPLPPVFAKANPENREDLKAIEKQVQKVLTKVLPCTVCVRAGGSGSGIIVSPDGLILTAGHVSGEPGRDVTIVMPDGKTHRGKTLGGNGTIDSGMVKLVDKGPWPYVEMGRSADLKKGDWCVVTGHPGGFRPGRSPVVRVGRVLEVNQTSPRAYIRTDCTLVGGDSGGPLFDMRGRVVGIHSRIGQSITANLHVPVDTYRETWDRLVKGERWGSGIGRPVRPTGEPDLGCKLDPAEKLCKVLEVLKGSAAEKAGLKAGDVIRKFDGKVAATAAALLDELKKKRPGEEATLEVLRGTETVTLKITLGRKAGA